RLPSTKRVTRAVDKKRVRKRLSQFWRQIAQQEFKGVRRSCDARRIDRTAAIAAAHVREFCSAELALLEEAINVLYSLLKVYDSSWRPKRSKERPLFWLFVSRQVSFLVSIRRLALAGLTEPACALQRAFSETCDVAIVLAGDDQFRQIYTYWKRGF